MLGGRCPASGARAPWLTGRSSFCLLTSLPRLATSAAFAKREKKEVATLTKRLKNVRARLPLAGRVPPASWAAYPAAQLNRLALLPPGWRHGAGNGAWPGWHAAAVPASGAFVAGRPQEGSRAAFYSSRLAARQPWL
jgi:hypothetical protein